MCWLLGWVSCVSRVAQCCIRLRLIYRLCWVVVVRLLVLGVLFRLVSRWVEIGLVSDCFSIFWFGIDLLRLCLVTLYWCSVL